MNPLASPAPPLFRSAPPLIVIGVDPGLDGALAALRSDGTLRTYEMPTLMLRGGNKRTLDLRGLIAQIDQLRIPTVTEDARVVIYLESVTASPQQGVVSAFTFGRTFGQTEALIAATLLPSNTVRPETWKRALSVPAAKSGAVARADALLPAYAHLWRGNRGGLRDGLAEAALIALYGMRQEGVRL